MPKEITLEDGTTMEVPTEEELQALQNKAKTAEELQAEIEKIKNDPQDKNWAQLRAKTANLEKALKEQGKEIDDDGNIVESKAPQFNEDEFIQKATTAAEQAAKAQLLNDYKQRQLNQLPADERDVVDSYFTKLSSGEDLDYGKIDKFMTDALRLARPDQQIKSGAPSIGLPPMSSLDAASQKRENFVDTTEGQSIFNEVNNIKPDNK